MAFRDFRSVGAVLREFPLDMRREMFLPEARLPLPDYFLTTMQFDLSRREPDESEAYYTENFVAPFLKQSWMRHPQLHVWSHRPLTATDRLTGEPDYLVSQALGGVVTDRLVRTPLLAVAEAKRQDFDEGWGQCLAAMLACQVANGDLPLTVYGIVSTGLSWEFGRLEGRRFTRQPQQYGLTDPELVNGMIDQLFAACERQLPPPPG